ncbi:MAG: hypothetical protein ACLR1G_13450 [Alistipes indistinctus]
MWRRLKHAPAVKKARLSIRKACPGVASHTPHSAAAPHQPNPRTNSLIAGESNASRIRLRMYQNWCRIGVPLPPLHSPLSQNA